MITPLAIGTALTAATVLIHALGSVWWVRYTTRRYTDPAGLTPLRMMHLLSKSAVILVILHSMECLIWAVTYYVVPEIDSITDMETAVYFSWVTFTSLGYGDVVIAKGWRLLAGLQAVAGLLVFGWSSALLFAALRQMMQDLDRQESKRDV